MNMTFNSELDIKIAPRKDLILYLELRGLTCHDHEPDDELRTIALENFNTEGACFEPIQTQG